MNWKFEDIFSAPWIQMTFAFVASGIGRASLGSRRIGGKLSLGEDLFEKVPICKDQFHSISHFFSDSSHFNMSTARTACSRNGPTGTREVLPTKSQKLNRSGRNVM